MNREQLTTKRQQGTTHGKRTITFFLFTFSLLICLFACKDDPPPPKDHTGEISGAAYDVPVVKVRGDKSISFTDFETAKGKLQAILNNMASRWPSNGKIKDMLKNPSFEFIVGTGDATPTIDANKSMPVGIDYLLGLGDDDIPTATTGIAIEINNHFSKATPNKSKNTLRSRTVAATKGHAQ